ncbi:nucleoside monophosphate kinase [Patescibacteria group bacterium]|nr:nucleoside monophosphate kinase [Patescibacteria group bacterium]
MKHLFFLVGKPASGKETQSRLLAEKVGFKMFSTGARFREIIASGSQLGAKIKGDYEKGLLMPAWVADYMFEDFIFNLPPEEGAVFEGSGRDREQAETIDRVCTWLGRPYTVFNLEVKDETVLARSMARGRDSIDKNEEAIKSRLSEYARLTHPAIQYFHSIGNCVDVDGEKTPEEVFSQMMDVASKKI